MKKHLNLRVRIVLGMSTIIMLIFELLLVFNSAYLLISREYPVYAPTFITAAIAILSFAISVRIIKSFYKQVVYCIKNNIHEDLLEYIISIIFLAIVSVYLGKFFSTVILSEPPSFSVKRVLISNLNKAVLAYQYDVEDFSLIGKEITPPNNTSIKVTYFELKELTNSIVVKKDGKEVSYGPYLGENYGDGVYNTKFIRKWIANSTLFEDGEMTKKDFKNYKFYYVVREDKFIENSAKIIIVLTNGDIPIYDFENDKVLNSIKIFRVN